MPTRTAFTLTKESAAPGRCLLTSRNHDLWTTPTTTKLCRILHHSQDRMPLPALTACDTPERIFRTQISFHLIPVPHLRLGGQKHRKLVLSDNLGILYIPMWRTLYQKRAVMTSSNFRQRTANEEFHHRHPWLDLRFIPVTNLLHHNNARQHTSDRHSSHSSFFFFFPRFIRVVGVKQCSLGHPGKLHSVVDGCMDFERPLVLFEHLYYSCVFQISLFFIIQFLVVQHEVLVLNLTSTRYFA